MVLWTAKVTAMLDVTSRGIFVSLLFVVFVCVTKAVLAQEAGSNRSSTAKTSDQEIASDHMDAELVQTLSTKDFLAESDRFTAAECKKGQAKATTSDGKVILLDGASYTLDSFADELIARYKQKKFYCVEIVGRSSERKDASHLLRRLRGVTQISSVTWQPK